MTDEKSLIEFPCDFPIKIIGINSPDFIQEIQDIVKKHHPEFISENLKRRDSEKSKFVSFTATVHATSQVKLDALYQELSKHPKIKMVL